MIFFSYVLLIDRISFSQQFQNSSTLIFTFLNLYQSNNHFMSVL